MRSLWVAALMPIALLAQRPAAAPKPDPAGMVSGATVYRSYCASCHGTDAKGSGPMAQSLTMKPSDLTVLARKSKGKFPRLRVEKMLGGTDELPVHGSKTMPVWGPALRQTGPNDNVTRQRAERLLEYLESIQLK